VDRLQKLNRWYESQCDGEWEHDYGVEIGTVDNPGWTLKIDLSDTELSDRPFGEIKRYNSETDWIFARRTEDAFEASCDPSKLADMVDLFLAWAEAAAAP
jgi:hypothetical protein